MLKPIDAASTTNVVWHMDPAINRDKSNLIEYMGKIFEDPQAAINEHLVFKEGAQPTIFEIGAVPPVEMTKIEEESGGMGNMERTQVTLMHLRIFLAGTVNIKNPPLNGQTRLPMVNINGRPRVDPEWLQTAFVRNLRACGIFVGSVCWAWNQLGEVDLKNS